MISKKLKFGDTIGLISPASPEISSKIKETISFLKKQGFKVKQGNHLYDKWGYLAGKDINRVSDITDMFLDDEIDMILCIRGGYGSMRLLPLIDFEIIKNNPKIFVGFSDITTLLNTIALRCNLITFHGPMGSSNFQSKETLKSFLNTIMKCNKPYSLSNPLNTSLNCIYKGKAKGRIVGGNLSLICSTLGTPYEIDTKNNILFIEEIDEKPYVIDRFLTQLYLAGKLQQCSGFILGQFKDCSLSNYENSLTIDDIINDKILSFKKPTLSNFMCGHSYPNLTLPIGAQAQIDCYSGKIQILEAVVK
ncbi:LD-carboxypeptidase [Clostridium aestuarii]|uniref:LD-carboxypeptidase n=1 Tax=Clostridium aestuarii TaxID=338193 RepID=A0ABT4D0Z4_9CLOT|nr:LD-carboxypeptidase [Clostridium aestuarii]MCY6484767.1 LD-carboxypeptidase [Clostridium aestuarii]